MNRVFALGLMIGLVFTPVFSNVRIAQAQAQLVEVGNKICPVSHEQVGKNGMMPQKVTYNGKIYNLCCGMCVKDFNKDPEKYAKIAEDEVSAAAAKN